MSNQQQACIACGGRCMKEVAFLTALPEETQQEILKHTSHVTKSKGEYLFQNGDRAGELFFVRTGEIKLCSYDASGREQITAIFSDGDAIWEGLFIQNSRYIYSALCATEVECCVIDQKSFEEAIQNTDSAMRVIGLLSEKLQDANRRNLIFSTYDSKARIAGFLLYTNERNPDTLVSIRLDDLAATTALRPETVSRKLSELQRDGIIERSGKSDFKLLKIEALKQIFAGA